jgi:hypothetical protein
MKVIQTEEDLAEIWRNYEYVGMDLAVGPDRHSISGHLLFQRIERYPMPYVIRVAGMILDEAFGTEVWPKYPDIEQMLLDCQHPLS